MKKRGLSRRLLSVLLALVMLLSLLPTAVFAATPKATLVTDASTLKAGDQITLRFGARTLTVEVLSVQETVKQADACTLYREIGR